MKKYCPFKNVENKCIEKKCGVWNEEAKGCGLRFLKEVHKE